MLINIGQSPESSDVVDLLLACHDRIRFFIDLALRLAGASGVSDDEIRDAAGRIVRYFSESLPLHVADEEESIIPRLTGRDPEIDRTLGAMHREHAGHEPDIVLLLKTCRALRDNPEELPRLRQALHDAAFRLAAELNSHLAEEERIVLPAIRSLLSEEERAAMLTELRARRSG
jgi:iron-sulfur cluster repair protein YtfE (RIC family)